MRFFSKVLAICNICFALFLFVHHLQKSDLNHENYRDIAILGPVETVLLILAFCSIILNFIMICMLAFYYATKTSHKISKPLLWFNFLFIFPQLYAIFVIDYLK